MGNVIASGSSFLASEGGVAQIWITIIGMFVSGMLGPDYLASWNILAMIWQIDTCMGLVQGVWRSLAKRAPTLALLAVFICTALALWLPSDIWYPPVMAANNILATWLGLFPQQNGAECGDQLPRGAGRAVRRQWLRRARRNRHQVWGGRISQPRSVFVRIYHWVLRKVFGIPRYALRRPRSLRRAYTPLRSTAVMGRRARHAPVFRPVGI